MKECKFPINISYQHINHIPFNCSEKLRIFIILKGSVKMSYVSGCAEFKKDDVEIIGVNEPVKITSSSKDSIVMIIEFDKDYLKQFYSDIEYIIINCNNFDFFYKKGNSNNSDLNMFKRYLRELVIELKRKDYIYHASLDNFVKKALLFAIDKFDNISNIFTHCPSQETYKERFKRIDVFFLKNISNRITLNDVARKEYLSLNYLSNEFKNKLNKSFNEILNYYRVKYSIRFLLEDQISISEISYICGFTAKKYYYKYFKQYMNCTPKQFKDENNFKIIAGVHYNIMTGEKTRYILNDWISNQLTDYDNSNCDEYLIKDIHNGKMFIIKKARIEDVDIITSYIKKHAKFAGISDRCDIDNQVIETSFFVNQYAKALIGYEDGIPVGIAIYFYNYSSLTGDRGIFIEDLFIDEDKRGLGYGKTMMNCIFHIAKNEKIKKIDWYCLKGNEKAIKMYKDMGAEQENELAVFTLELDYSK